MISFGALIIALQKMIIQQLQLPPHATESDKVFWENDYDNRHPQFENRLLLHYPVIRNRLGSDLTNGTGYAFVADDLVLHLKQEANKMFCLCASVKKWL